MKKILLVALLLVVSGIGFNKTASGFGAAVSFDLGIVDFFPGTITIPSFTFAIPPGMTLPSLPPPPAPPTTCPTNKLCIYPNTLTFPDTPADGTGGAKSAMTVTLSNPAGAPTYVISDSLGGSASPFYVDPSSYAATTITPEGRTIAPGQTIILVTYFDPASEGTANNTLNVSYAAYGNPPGLTDADKDGAEHIGSDGRRYIYTDVFGFGVGWNVVDCCVENGGGGFGASSDFYMPVGSLAPAETASIALSGNGTVLAPPPTDPVCPTAPVWEYTGTGPSFCAPASLVPPLFSGSEAPGTACAPLNANRLDNEVPSDPFACSIPNVGYGGDIYTCRVPACSVTPASFSVSPTSLNFTDTLSDGIGNTVSAPQTVRITNSGGTAGSVVFALSNSDYQLLRSSPVNIPGNSFVDVAVVFDPQGINARPGQLSFVPSNGPAISPVTLSGNGTALPTLTSLLTATAPGCTIPVNQSTCTASLSWTVTNPVAPSVRQGGVQFSTDATNPGTPRTVQYGVTPANSITVYDGVRFLGQLDLQGVCAGGSSWDTTAGKCVASPSVNGACGVPNNACTAGSLNDTLDDETNYLWSCNGSGGGSNASCSRAKSSGSGSTQCSDGNDNDTDTKIDMSDPGCSDPSDDDETNSTPGGCPPTVDSLCTIPSAAVGATSGTCASGSGTCVYTCQVDGTWRRDSNSCTAPVTISLTANPREVRPGATTTISWDVTNGNEALCTLSGAGIMGNPMSPSTGDPEKGTHQVTINGRTMFTLTCPTGSRTIEVFLLTGPTGT